MRSSTFLQSAEPIQFRSQNADLYFDGCQRQKTKFQLKEIAIWHSIFHLYNLSSQTKLVFQSLFRFEVATIAVQGLHLEIGNSS